MHTSTCCTFRDLRTRVDLLLCLATVTFSFLTLGTFALLALGTPKSLDREHRGTVLNCANADGIDVANLRFVQSEMSGLLRLVSSLAGFIGNANDLAKGLWREQPSASFSS